MNREYKVTRYITDRTEEEKEEIYKGLARIFIEMAQRDLTKERRENK